MEGKKKKGQEDLATIQLLRLLCFFENRKLTENTSVTGWRVTSDLLQNTYSHQINHGRQKAPLKALFQTLKMEDKDRELPSRYFLELRLSVKLPQSRDTHLALVCFREILFGCQGFQTWRDT